MSDPVTNIEIEDVLSSIRRLVSEESGLKSRAEPARKRPHENRLVLTPSLRVADEPSKPRAVSEPKVDSGQQDDTETPWSDPGKTLYSAAQIDADDAPDAISVAGNHFNKGEVSEEHTTDDEGGEPAETLDVEALKDVSFVDEQPDGQNEDGHPQEPDIDATQQSAEEKRNAVGFDNLTPLSAKIEALEMAIGEKQDQWEPDGASGDDYAGTPVQTLQWKDHDANSPEPDDFAANSQHPFEATVVEIATAREQPAPAASFSVEENTVADEVGADEAGDDEGGLDFLANDEGIIDEDALRELVADIVREELQGALGERITRNVRKLVRREIQRALTAQDLD